MIPYMFPYMFPYMTQYMIPYMIPYRYIWAYREDLCRSVHDMTKQKYDSKKYSSAAWSLLAKWVRDAPAAQLDLREETLTCFTNESKEFWLIVAKCLRAMSLAPNRPWGISAMQPSVYLAVPCYEKVVAKYTLGCIFFSSFVPSNHIWTLLR